MAFSLVLLLPIDVASSDHLDCVQSKGDKDCEKPWIQLDRDLMMILWKVLYWTTYVLCWTAYPVLQSYTMAGEFGVGEKMLRAVKENLIFYTICLVVVGILLIAITITRPHDMNGTAIYGVAIAASNAWGLLVLIGLLGHGLVEIPKRLWRHANRTLTLRHYQWQAVHQKEAFEKAKRELMIALKRVKKYADKVPKHDPLRGYIEEIVEKCPMQYRDIIVGEGEAEMSYSKLVSLHRKVVFYEWEVLRSKSIYERTLHRAFRLDDIVKARQGSETTIHWTFKKKRSGTFASQINFFEWLWKLWLEPLMLRLFALICAGMSLVVVYSEVVFGIPHKPNLSVFALLYSEEVSFTLQWLFVFIPVGYISFCAAWSLFQIRLFTYYRLLDNHQSDGGSLLFSAAYLCRLTAPMAFNYLLMAQINNTAFSEVMGALTLTILGTDFNYYFPGILIILCLINMFNLYTKFVTTFCLRKFVNRFVFDESFTDSQIDRGRDLIDQERLKRERGIDDDSFLTIPKSPSTYGKSSPAIPRERDDETVRFKIYGTTGMGSPSMRGQPPVSHEIDSLT
eukprot:TRINITY_DN6229_c0_g1_i1.p1 TRINITY_DN6229_c0_g1~~TRINITY_DN6229_c0_g1_i1.p1  ORF type:complete len:649 (-),score=115.17 TRINITY_DN6229_c0_g1_i1:51-1745(-)